MGIDEAATLACLKALRRELIDPMIAAHSGRIVKLMGDGALVEFASVVDTVICAIEIQRRIGAHDARGPEGEQIQLRIGINVGDVMVDDDDIYGDGVNVAARIEGLAEPGGICLSEAAYRQVRDKVAADLSGRSNGANALCGSAPSIHGFSRPCMASAFDTFCADATEKRRPRPVSPSSANLASAFHMFLAAPLAKLGQTEEAKAAAARLLALQPTFTIRGFCAAVGVVPELGGPLTEALLEAGLPE